MLAGLRFFLAWIVVEVQLTAFLKPPNATIEWVVPIDASTHSSFMPTRVCRASGSRNPLRVSTTFGDLTLASRPKGTVRAVRYRTNLRKSPIKDRVKRLGLMFCAADLIRYTRKRSIRHIHCHSAAEGAHLVALCRLLGAPTYGRRCMVTYLSTAPTTAVRWPTRPSCWWTASTSRDRF